MSRTQDFPEFQAACVTTSEEREAVYAIRMLVFVEEQNFPADAEFDLYDLTATHFLVRTTALPLDDPQGIVATARLIAQADGVGKVGRVAVLPAYRQRGVGHLLMRSMEEYARAQGFTRLILEAQLSALPFYAKLGYIPEGPLFFDFHVEHQLMWKALTT